MTKQQKQEREEAITKLRGFVNPGDTIYTIRRHVSTSGMSRIIDMKIMRDNSFIHIGGNASAAIGLTWDDRKQGVKVSGCGMDMGYHLVYTLASVLFPDGFECVGLEKRCPSNDHSNGDRNYEPHHHTDGGYALRHIWL